MKKLIVLFFTAMFVLLINAQQIGTGWTTRIPDFSGVLNTGAFEGERPNNGVPDSVHTYQHLFVMRHSNPNNNHQFQLGTTYAENDRLFFRKIAGDTIPKSTAWNEIATRGANNFTGNQTFNGSLILNNGITFNHQRIDFTTPPRTTLNPMSIKLWDNYNNGGPTPYGTVMEIYGYSGHQTSQLYFGGWDNSRIRYREAFYNQNTWSDWVTLLDSKNDIESQGNLKMMGSGNHYFLNGNVGIGTITPQAGLHVTKFSIIDSTKVAAVLGADYNQWTYFGGVAGGRIRGSNEGYLVIEGNPNGSGDKNVYLGATENVLIARAEGRVGIGTTSPQAKLEVVGKTRFQGDIWGANVISFADDARFKITKTTIPSLLPDTFSMPQYGIAAPGTSGAADLWIAGYNGIKMFTDGNATSRFSIMKDGNIGIGTSAPQVKLHLDNDGAFLAQGTYDNGWTESNLGAGTRVLWYPRKAAFRAGHVNSTQWDNNNIGNYSFACGFSTTSSGTSSIAMGHDSRATNSYAISMGMQATASNMSAMALGYQVTASGKYATSLGYVSRAEGENSIALGKWVNATGTNSIVIGLGASSSSRLVNNTPNSLMVGFNTATPALFVGSKVGIGTKNPDEMLTVKGKIHAEEVIIDLSVPAADYVFNSDYSLMPLHKVEAFVKTNKHLPEIPSAVEVKEKGFSIGEMQNKLLQKIEELTLYVIELQKTNEKQSAEIEALKRK